MGLSVDFETMRLTIISVSVDITPTIRIASGRAKAVLDMDLNVHSCNLLSLKWNQGHELLQVPSEVWYRGVEFLGLSSG